MKLGLSAETYRWVAFPWMRADSQKFRFSGRTIPYFTTPEPPKNLDLPIDWMLDRVSENSLSSLSMECGWLGEERRAARFKAKTDDLEIAYFATVSANLAASEEEWGAGASGSGTSAHATPVFDPGVATVLRTGWTGGSPFEVVVRAMELASAAGARMLSIVHGAPDRPNRFTKDPPLAQQVERMIKNLRTLMPVAESMGLVLTNEAHMDYGCAELAEVLDGVDSPWLRHTFDFGDPVFVNEDPLEAAHRVAKYTVATHIKDLDISPLTEIALGAVFHAPIGSGRVPVKKILAVLQAEAPDPESLHHCLEVTPRQDNDVGLWVEASLAWLRKNCAEYWTS
jgi:sugar phosphate isomerase/epimerase